VSPRKAPVRRCSWHHCAKPAAATIRFVLPNLLAGGERDYCQSHTELVTQAEGTRVVRRFGPRQPTLPGMANVTVEVPAAGPGRTDRKGVMPNPVAGRPPTTATSSRARAPATGLAVPTRPRNDGLHGARELPEDVAGTATCAPQSGERPDTTG
jgi:hypothetical protein